MTSVPGKRLFDRIDALPPLSEVERELFESVRRLAEEKLAPRAAGYDERAEFPWDNVRDMNDLGLNAVFVPEAYGGAGLSFCAYLLYVREISKACAATGIIWSTNFHAIKAVIDHGSEELKRRILPSVAEGALVAVALTEAGAGSDAKAIETRFTPDGDDVLVEGSKVFITNGDVADYVVTFGKWAGPGEAEGAISLLVVERGTEGFTIDRIENKMGIRDSSTAALSFSGCRVPRANLVGAPGDGLALLFAFLNRSRPSVAAHALGIARAAFEDMIAYVNARRQSGRRIVDNQGVQFMIADMASELALCERWLWHVGALADAGEADLAVEASMLKLRAGDLAMRIATDAVQLHGASGYIRDNRVERLMRDAKVTQIWEGANQIQRQLIGRAFAERQG